MWCREGALLWMVLCASERRGGELWLLPPGRPAARCSASLSRAAGGAAAHSGDPRAPSPGSGRSGLGRSGRAPPGAGSARPGPGPAGGARRSPIPAPPARPRRHFPSGGRAAVARCGRGVAPGSPGGARPGPPLPGDGVSWGRGHRLVGWVAGLVCRPLQGTSESKNDPSCWTLFPAPSPQAFLKL